MTTIINLGVNSDLLKEADRMDENLLTDVCDEELQKHISYLELVLKGWKTYKNVKREHRRILFMMLMSENKDPLHDYERLVLHPKMLKKEKNEKLLPFTEVEELDENKNLHTADGESITSVAELGADNSYCSTEEENGSSIQGSPQTSCSRNKNAFHFEQVNVPEIKIGDMRGESVEKLMVNETCGSMNSKLNNTVNLTPTSKAIPLSVTNRPSDPLLYLQNIIDHVDTVESPEDNTVVGVENNTSLAENIALAAQRVRNAIDNVQTIQSSTKSAIGTSISKLEQLQLESKAMKLNYELASQMIDSNRNGNFENMSKGCKKRAKKAAKKAAGAVEEQRKIVEAKEDYIKQSLLAANALAALNLIPPVAPPVISPSTIGESAKSDNALEELNKLELTEEELKALMRISASGKLNFEPGSEEDIILSKHAGNTPHLKAQLLKQMCLEKEYNAKMLHQINQLTNEIQSGREELTKEDEIEIAKRQIALKLNSWKKSDDPRAPYFIDMYEYFMANCSYAIANLIVGYLPYENLPGVKFEETMLLQFQSGKISFKKV